MKTVVKITMTIFLLLVSAAGAQAPRTISFQGVAVDDNGVVLPDDSYDMRFRLYDAAAGGVVLWEELQAVPVTSGRFDVTLGDATPLALAFDAPYWLAVKIETDPEMTERIELAASPYAFHAAAVADSAVDGFAIAGGTVVRSLNALTDDVTIAGGTNVTVTTGNDTIFIDATPGGGGLSLPYTGLANSTSDAFYLLQQGTGRAATFIRDSAVYGPALWVVSQQAGAAAQFDGGPITVDHSHDGPTYLTIRNTDTGGSSVERINFTNENGDVAFIAAFDDNWINDRAVNSLMMANNRPNGRLVFQTGAQNRLGVANDGTVEFGMADAITGVDGTFKLYKKGSAADVIHGFSNERGGAITMNDEEGNLFFRAWGDNTGTGNILDLYRGVNKLGLQFNGNWGGTESPRLSIYGNTQVVTFAMDQTGDDAVQFFPDAVSSPEILDEAGGASAASNTVTALTSTNTAVLSRSITAPAGGYVLVLGSGQATLTHTNGTTTGANLGVTDDVASMPYNQDVAVGMSASASTGAYNIPFAVHAMFDIAGGATRTFYLTGKELGGGVEVYDPQLTLVYLPTAYGTTTIPSAPPVAAAPDATAPGSAGLSRADIDGERARSRAANAERMQRELDGMRERLRRLEAEVAAERAGRR